jgi:hypothetical protein
MLFGGWVKGVVVDRYDQQRRRSSSLKNRVKMDFQSQKLEGAGFEAHAFSFLVFVSSEVWCLMVGF